MSQLIAVLDQVADVDVAVELFQKRILSELVSGWWFSNALKGRARGGISPVNELVVYPEGQDEVDELLLDLRPAVLIGPIPVAEDGDGKCRLAVHRAERRGEEVGWRRVVEQMDGVRLALRLRAAERREQPLPKFSPSITKTRRRVGSPLDALSGASRAWWC